MADEHVDDLSIMDDEGLLRRVPNQPNMIKYDENIQAHRPTSACFCDRQTQDKELSITLEKPLKDSGGSEESAIQDNPGFGLARLLAGTVRHDITPNQIITRAPTGADPHHGLVIGDKTKATKRTLAKKASLIITPQLDEK